MLYDIDSCVIDRNTDKARTAGVAIVYDEKSDVIGNFPSTMTDGLIKFALMFANDAYDAGFQHGEQYKIRQLKQCLNIS